MVSRDDQPSGTNRPALSLHVPEPPFRPGDPVDYSFLHVPRPDEIARPEVFAQAADIRDLAYGLVRVLDDADQAVGRWNLRLDGSFEPGVFSVDGFPG